MKTDVRNGEIIEIDKDLRIIKDPSNRSERLFVDGKIIASADNTAFRERTKMSSEGLLVIQIGQRKSKKILSVQFSSFGLPRFEDYLDELKKNAERYLNNETKRKGRYKTSSSGERKFIQFVAKTDHKCSGIG